MRQIVPPAAGRRKASPSEIDRGKDFGRALVEGAADCQETFDAGQIGATFDGADLRNAELGHGGQVLQRPVTLHAQHLDAMAEAFAQTVLCRTAEAELVDGVLERLAELRE